MRRLEVALVAPSLDILGGHSVQAAQLLKAWSTDPDVHAWLVPINPTPPPILRLGTRIKYVRTVVTEATYVPLLMRRLKQADIVHAFSASYSSFLLAPLPAMLVARALGRPVVLNYHSGEAADHLARSPLARRWAARANRTVVPSPFLAEVFSRFGVHASVTPNLIDVDRFAFRERRPIRPRLLSTRNLNAPYNVACTVRAFRFIQKAWPEATLTIVGTGPHRPALEQLVSELALRHVQFLGRIEPDRMQDVYADHDVYVQSPDIDNMPLSVLEAFASGLPVVSTDVGGVPAILHHQTHGLLVPPDDDAALAEAIAYLLNDPDTARDMARAARQSVERYTWPSVRDSWLRVYHSVLRQPHRTSLKVSR